MTMAHYATARLHSHSFTSTSALCNHQHVTCQPLSLGSLVQSGFSVCHKHQAQGLVSSRQQGVGAIRCSGSDGRKPRLPSLDPPKLYKPLWTPGGFSPGPASPSSGDVPLEREPEPQTEEEWLAREAKRAAKEGERAAKRKEMLEQLQNRLGTWHERVRTMRVLQKAGDISADEIADEARLVGLDSTRLLVAGSVYDSLTEDVEADVLKRFEDPDGPTVLYEMRTLSVAQRGPVAEYVVENGLGADETREVVKAVKDHERRPENREGFTEAPGDALAFWYFRNAGETREPEKRARLLERAAEVAVTDSAKERLSEDA